MKFPFLKKKEGVGFAGFCKNISGNGVVMVTSMLVTQSTSSSLEFSIITS